MSETRKIAAILVADIVGYSRLAGTDEDRPLSRLRGLRSDLIDPAIAAHHGRIVKAPAGWRNSGRPFKTAVDDKICGGSRTGHDESPNQCARNCIVSHRVIPFVRYRR
jgi:hypothetical protein